MYTFGKQENLYVWLRITQHPRHNRLPQRSPLKRLIYQARRESHQALDVITSRQRRSDVEYITLIGTFLFTFPPVFFLGISEVMKNVCPKFVDEQLQKVIINMQTLNVVIEIIKVIAVLIASVIAWWGIDSWRRETRWKIKYNLAEEVLTLAFQIQEAVREIRSPFSQSGEGKSRKRGENESPDNTELWDRAYVLYERYHSRQEPFNKMRTAKHRFLAVYGREHEELFERLDKQINEIFAANDILLTVYWGSAGKEMVWDNEAERKQHHEEMREYGRILRTSSIKDEFGQQFNGIIDEFEKMCGPIIRNEQKGRYFIKV